MKKYKDNLLSIIIRYFVLIIVAAPGLIYFYYIFSPLTLYPVYFLLDLLYCANLTGSVITLNGIYLIEIIGACIAGSAYYFLLILNLSVPNIKWKKRLKMLGFSFGIFLIINILRIFILATMYVSGSSFFDISHKIFWYLGSTLFIVLIWFLEVKVFKIKGIPFYSDLKVLYKQSLFGKSKKHTNKKINFKKKNRKC